MEPFKTTDGNILYLTVNLWPGKYKIQPVGWYWCQNDLICLYKGLKTRHHLHLVRHALFSQLTFVNLATVLLYLATQKIGMGQNRNQQVRREVDGEKKWQLVIFDRKMAEKEKGKR